MIEHKDSPEAPNLMGSSENREMESEEEKESGRTFNFLTGLLLKVKNIA
jgi:hypothetical protein